MILITLSESIKPYIEDKYDYPKYLISKFPVQDALYELAKYIGDSKSTLAINELSKLLESEMITLKKAINKSIWLMAKFFKIKESEDKQKRLGWLTIKMRSEPLMYLSILLGILRLTGQLTDNLKYLRPKKIVVIRKIQIPDHALDKYKIIKKTCPDSIDNYPDTVMMLTVNCLLPGLTLSKYPWRGVSALEIALYTLGCKLLQDKELRNDTALRSGDKKVVLCVGENTEVRGDEISIHTQSRTTSSDDAGPLIHIDTATNI